MRHAVLIAVLSASACGGGSGSAPPPGIPSAVAVRHAAALGASSWASTEHGIAGFQDGSSVVAGSFVGEALLGEGEPGETLLVAEDASDSFVARYRADGGLAWARRMGGTENDAARGVVALPDGSCVVTGYFWGDITFGEGEPGETSAATAGNADLFVARLRPDGSLAWVRTAGGLDHDYARAIAAFPDGSSVVVGSYGARPATFGSGEPNEAILPDAGTGMDLFVARYGPDGTLAWARAVAGAFDGPPSVAAYPDGTFVVTGGFAGSALFGAGEPEETAFVATHSNATDVFVARFGASGRLAWARRARAASASSAAGCSVAALDNGGCLVAGTYRDRALFGEGEPHETELLAPAESPFHAFVALFDGTGALAWARGVETANLGTGPQVAAYPNGSFALAGMFTGTAVFGGPTAIQLESEGASDAYLAGFDPEGNALWAEQAGGPGDAVFKAIALAGDGSIVVTGFFLDSVDFDGTEAVATPPADPELPASLLASYR